MTTFKKFLVELNSPELARLDAKNKAAYMAAKYDGKPMKITLPVLVGTKIENRKFTIDNLLPVRRALAGKTLKDMRTVESDPKKHADKQSYIIHDPTGTKGSSIPQRLHGLPRRTRRKPGYAPEDLRREAYDA